MQSRHIGCSHEHKVPQLLGYAIGQSALTVPHRGHVVSSCDKVCTGKRFLLWRHRVGLIWILRVRQTQKVTPTHTKS